MQDSFKVMTAVPGKNWDVVGQGIRDDFCFR